jgi:hypothetical protein
MITPAAVILNNVLFPAIFGPVSSIVLGRGSLFSSPPPRCKLLEMKSDRKHIDGCRRSSKSTNACGESTNSGRHLGSSRSDDALAKERRQSSSAITLRNDQLWKLHCHQKASAHLIIFSHSVRSLSNSTSRCLKKFFFAAFCVSLASCNARITGMLSGV